MTGGNPWPPEPLNRPPVSLSPAGDPLPTNRWVVAQARLIGELRHHASWLQQRQSFRASITPRRIASSRQVPRAKSRSSSPLSPGRACSERPCTACRSTSPRCPASGETRARISDSSDDESAPLHSGAVELNGTTVQSWAADLRRPGEMTTIGRFLTISGALIPVSKSHISACRALDGGLYTKVPWGRTSGRRQMVR